MTEKIGFIVSDIHSFYIELKDALWQAGFRKTNKNHYLVVLGDIFDRGPDSVSVYNYIKSIPRNRRILVRGNHEDLYLELLAKSFPEEHDFSNHTVDTFCQIADYNFNKNERGYLARLWQDGPEIKKKVLNSPITKGIKSKEWKDYFEINNKFICVHSFIPTVLNQSFAKSEMSYFWNYLAEDAYEYLADGRNGDWYAARWGCPGKHYKLGHFAQEEAIGNTLICGHGHTADFAKYLGNLNKEDFTDIFYSNGIIGIDGGVGLKLVDNTKILYHPQNVLVIKGHDCFDKNGNKLKNMILPQSEQDKNSYWLAPGTDMFDRAVCCADCATDCARLKAASRICTMSDFSGICSKFIKK